jgi:hypothetical protein
MCEKQKNRIFRKEKNKREREREREREKKKIYDDYYYSK